MEATELYKYGRGVHPVCEELLCRVRSMGPGTGSFSDILILSPECSDGHGIGTAAMSERGAKWGVLDPDLRVKGTTGLRVVDASALPYVPTGHSELSLYSARDR